MKSAQEISRLYGTREVMEAVMDAVHGDVLDFGAGTSKLRAPILKTAKSYTSFDMDELPGVDIVGDVLDPKLPDSSFDTIISNQVMEHVRKPWVMVGHMARMLRPGGTIIVTAPFLYPYHADPNDYFRYTDVGMQSLFTDAGLDIVLCTKYGGWWSTISVMVKQRYFNPYSKKKSWFRRRLANLVESTFRLLDRTTPPGIAYSNVLCIAQKPNEHHA